MHRALLILHLVIIMIAAQPLWANNATCTDVFKKTDETSRPRAAHDFLTPELSSAMDMAENLANLGLASKLFSRREVEHLKEDLAELREHPNPKSPETFNHMLNQWTLFMKDVEAQLAAFNSLPRKEQRALKSKMESALYFATGHFIVFLETRKDSFDYQRMNNILEGVNGRSNKTDLLTFLYMFEKQIFKFSNLREIRRCKA